MHFSLNTHKLVALLAALTLMFALGGCASSAGNSASSGSSGASVSTGTTSSASTSGTSSVSSASSAPAPSSTSPSTSGALHVEGTQLVDENGNAVQLRGASTHGLAWFPVYVNDDFFRELRADWGANVVRLAMYTAESGGYCTDGDKMQLRKLVDDGVHYATDNDLYVIVDWHILSDNDPNMHADEAEAFFRDVSAAYADHNNVLYEICNEPNGSTTWEDVKGYAERIVPVIRANDPDAVIIVGTPTWSQDVDAAAADPLDFENVMYALHFYAATHKDDLRARAAAALDAGLPIFVTEFGICDASGNGATDEEQASAWIAFLDERGVSYVMWNLSNKAESSAMFKATCDKVAGFEDADLSVAGSWLKRLLSESAGTPAGASASNIAGSQAAQSSQASQAEQAGSSNVAGEGPMQTGRFTCGDIECRASLRSSWTSGNESYFLYDLTLVNNGETLSSWSIDVPFNAEVKLSDSWNGVFEATDTTVHVSNAEYNGAIAHGSSISDVGFIVIGPPDLKIAA